MAKLAIFATLFVALFAFSTVTSHTTKVTTTVVDEEHDPSCDTEIQSMEMGQCGMWMMHKMGGRGGRVNEMYPMLDPTLQMCCSELQSVSSPCRCEALRKMMMDMQKEPKMMGKMEDIWKMAKSLPEICKMESTQCSMRAVFF